MSRVRPTTAVSMGTACLAVIAGCSAPAAEPTTAFTAASEAPGWISSSSTKADDETAPAADGSPETPTHTGPTDQGPTQGPTAQQDPAPVEVPDSGTGKTSPVTIPGRDSAGDGRVIRYTVEIEGGLEEIAADFPRAVRWMLRDQRGWEARDGVRFVHVSREQARSGASADIRILFASPDLVDRMCAPMRTNGRLSCHSRGKVMINAWRWVHGANTFGDDLAAYRTYLVNHEVGHALGHGHLACPGPGRTAPVMLQQTLRLDGCLANPYPGVR